MINKKTKIEVYERDKGRCVLCSSSYPLEKIPHHAFFRSSYFAKDRDESWNLCTICQKCHSYIHFASNNEEVRRSKEYAKKCRQIAFDRYKGENRDKLIEVIRNRYGSSWRRH